MNEKTTILFYLFKVKLNKKGMCPLRCRITYKKKRKEFSTGLFINPDNWKSKEQTANNNTLNTQISLIKQEINQAFLFLKVNKEQLDVEDIYLQYKGENIKEDETVLEVFKAHNNRVEKLIGKEYVLATLWKFNQAMTLLKGFIKHHYKKNDYLFKDLDIKFIKDYEFYLKSERNLAQSSIYKMIQRFKKIIKIAISEGYLDKDPFIMYKCKNPKITIVYLTVEELKVLEEHQFSQTKLEQVKDMFIFCCYTGLAYQEMANLKKHHIIKGFDGNLWIEIIRAKTTRKISIPLLPVPLELLNKYAFELPTISNQKFNSYLKEIADIVGIDKKLTHHTARKTFATTVLLYNDVPMEIVSELLGHSSITITESHYGKIVPKKVSEEMLRLMNNYLP
jgi:integrase